MLYNSKTGKVVQFVYLLFWNKTLKVNQFKLPEPKVKIIYYFCFSPMGIVLYFQTLLVIQDTLTWSLCKLVYAINFLKKAFFKKKKKKA